MTDSEFTEHPNLDVRIAWRALLNALFEWEWASGLTSVVCLRETGGTVIRAVSGQPVLRIHDPTSDEIMVVNEALDTVRIVPFRLDDEVPTES